MCSKVWTPQFYSDLSHSENLKVMDALGSPYPAQYALLEGLKPSCWPGPASQCAGIISHLPSASEKFDWRFSKWNFYFLNRPKHVSKVASHCSFWVSLQHRFNENRKFQPSLSPITNSCVQVRASKILVRWMPEGPTTESKITMTLLGDNQDLSIYNVEAVSQIY